MVAFHLTAGSPRTFFVTLMVGVLCALASARLAGATPKRPQHAHWYSAGAASRRLTEIEPSVRAASAEVIEEWRVRAGRNPACADTFGT